MTSRTYGITGICLSLTRNDIRQDIPCKITIRPLSRYGSAVLVLVEVMWEIIGEEKHLNARIACRGTRLRVEVLDLLRLIKQDIVTREKTYKEKSASTRVLRVEALDWSE